MANKPNTIVQSKTGPNHYLNYTPSLLIAFYLVLNFTSFITMAAADDRWQRVTFWSNAYHRGDQFHLWMLPNRCYALAPGGKADKRFSSISAFGTCIDVFTRSDCFGGMMRMEANRTLCHRNLGDCDMNDRISSVRLCPRCRRSCYYQRTRENGAVIVHEDREEDCLCQCNCGQHCDAPNK